MAKVQGPPASTELAGQVADHIRSYSDTFGESFHKGDPSLLRPFCHVPSVSIGRGRVFDVSTIEESDERWRRAHASLPEDYQYSVLHTVDVMMTDKRTAFVTVDCGRFNKAGEEYHRFFASYITVLTDTGWRITTWIGHDEDEPAHTVL